MKVVLNDSLVDLGHTLVLFLHYHFEDSLQRAVRAFIQIAIFNHLQIRLVKSIDQRMEYPHNNPTEYRVNQA